MPRATDSQMVNDLGKPDAGLCRSRHRRENRLSGLMQGRETAGASRRCLLPTLRRAQRSPPAVARPLASAARTGSPRRDGPWPAASPASRSRPNSPASSPPPAGPSPDPTCAPAGGPNRSAPPWPGPAIVPPRGSPRVGPERPWLRGVRRTACRTFGADDDRLRRTRVEERHGAILDRVDFAFVLSVGEDDGLAHDFGWVGNRVSCRPGAAAHVVGPPRS